MTPQSHFMIVAPVLAGHVEALKSLLASITDLPGMANPKNPLVPFGIFDRLHYARFVITDDGTSGDLEHFGVPIPSYPVALAFLGDCDGSPDEFLAQLADGAGDGLRKIFSHCERFEPEADLLIWMRQNSVHCAACYVNWVGRTVRQVREEDALRNALLSNIQANPTTGDDLQGIRNRLIEFVHAECDAERLTLTPPEPTPFDWHLRDLLHLATVPVALGILLVAAWLIPLLLGALALFILVFLWVLRHYEKTEPEIIVRPPPDHGKMLAEQEDHDVTNPFTVIGSVKPSTFRRLTLIVILWLIDYGARHIYNRGHLGRIRTIQFARWVFLNDKKRVLFASNYDGSLESYMDDFINKVGWGLNLVFSNGVGYPRTHWLVSYGSKEEQKFKYTLRRHQVPTQVWYKAYPGLTAFDLARNSRIRQGIERKSMSNAEIHSWLRDL